MRKGHPERISSCVSVIPLIVIVTHTLCRSRLPTMPVLEQLVMARGPAVMYNAVNRVQDPLATVTPMLCLVALLHPQNEYIPLSAVGSFDRVGSPRGIHPLGDRLWA